MQKGKVKLPAKYWVFLIGREVLLYICIFAIITFVLSFFIGNFGIPTSVRLVGSLLCILYFIWYFMTSKNSLNEMLVLGSYIINNKELPKLREYKKFSENVSYILHTGASGFVHSSILAEVINHKESIYKMYNAEYKGKLLRKKLHSLYRVDEKDIASYCTLFIIVGRECNLKTAKEQVQVGKRYIPELYKEEIRYTTREKIFSTGYIVIWNIFLLLLTWGMRSHLYLSIVFFISTVYFTSTIYRSMRHVDSIRSICSRIDDTYVGE